MKDVEMCSGEERTKHCKGPARYVKEILTGVECHFMVVCCNHTLISDIVYNSKEEWEVARMKHNLEE